MRNDRCSRLGPQARGCGLGSRGIGPHADQRHRIHGGTECPCRSLGERRCALDPRRLDEALAQGFRVAAARELGWNEKRDHAAWPRQLERALRERDRQIGEVREPARRSSAPAGVPHPQRFAHTRRQALGADPWWVAGDEIEAALEHHVREVGLEREERRAAVAAHLPHGRAQVAQSAPRSGQLSPLVGREPASPAEEVAVAGSGEQVPDCRLERRDAVIQQLSRQRGLRAGELCLRRALCGTRQVKQAAARSSEATGFGCAAAKRAAAQRSREGQRVEQCVALPDVAVEIRERGNHGDVGRLVVGYEREPEPQLGQADRGESEIDAEQ